MAIDLAAFKTAMRQLAGHVCIITTASRQGARRGLTATAVCCVSATPPMLLGCVNRQSGSHAAIVEAGIFAVNVLPFEDRHLADRFSGTIAGDARFADGVWRILETGAPVLESALASFDCQLVQAVDVATHGILFGAILEVRVRKTKARPLLYAHGSYGIFTALAPEASPDLLLPWDTL